MEENPLRDESLMKELIRLRESDPDAFMQMVIEALKKNPDAAVEDSAPAQKKLVALESLMRYFQEIEGYEDCAFIRDLKQRIADESKK
jgi:hypothetical protein